MNRDVMKQRGVALAVVMWFIAGMSLLVAGLVYNARLDTRMAQVHVSKAKVAAAGDGAINLMLADLVNESLAENTGSLLPVQRYSLGGLLVEVRLLPANALLNLNSTERQTLEALFTLATGMDPTAAQSAAENVVKWRRSSGASGNRNSGRREFTVAEDLLQVEGLSRSHYDALRDYLTAGAIGRGGTDWALAGALLHQVLEMVDPVKAETMALRRARAQERSAGSERKNYSKVKSFRADATINYGGRTWLRRRWVEMERTGDSALPWRVVRTEPPRVVQGETGIF